MVARHWDGGDDICDHEDPLEDAEVGCEDEGRGQGTKSESDVIECAKIFILLQSQCVQVYSRN